LHFLVTIFLSAPDKRQR